MFEKNSTIRQAEPVLREVLPKFHPDPMNPRKRMPPDYIRKLADSMLADGQRIPVIARPHPDLSGELMLIDGHCRWEAKKLNGQPFLDYILKSGPMTESEVLAFQLDTSVISEKLSPFDIYDALARYMQLEGLNQVQVAKRRHVSQATVSRILSIDLLARDLKPYVDNFQVVPSVAYLIASLPTPEMQREMMKKAIGPPALTRDHVQRLVDEAKGRKQRGPKAIKTKTPGGCGLAVTPKPKMTPQAFLEELKEYVKSVGADMTKLAGNVTEDVLWGLFRRRGM